MGLFDHLKGHHPTGEAEAHAAAKPKAEAAVETPPAVEEKPVEVKPVEDKAKQ